CAEHGDEALREHGRDDLVAAASDHHVERGRRLVAPAALEDEVDGRLSGEELRSGRKTTVSTTTPKTTVPASARTRATTVATPSEVSHRNRYAATIELAPVARLMTPDPR